MNDPIDVDAILMRFSAALAGISDREGLYQLQVEYLGKKGVITNLSKGLGQIDPTQRKAAGERINALRRQVDGELAEQEKVLQSRARAQDLARHEDLTWLGEPSHLGTLHPLTRTRRVLEDVFSTLGFAIEDGPHVEFARFNFDDLNIGPDHPARDMADTFFVHPPTHEGLGPEPAVLRTHTSPVQVRTMRTQRPPIKMVALGTVFRRDDDATHSPMFHQIEGLCVDQGVSFIDLRDTLYRFVEAFFGQRLSVRFRPSFFPFVEPGAEFDMQCPFCAAKGCSVCKGSGWIELGGAGMVHPRVFAACDIDPDRYTGWAFGFGIDRMAMLMHQIHDLRLMFDGDVRFAEQFPC